ncbi:short-chain dehydrogenase [Paenibacillus riograndensis]|uniref:Short-chain dehydrogenase n=1 Tax=Paenibacillus riograndensis TaxID=483937 RepID=A0A132U477_9BACL|nr:SDR family oxidoreductase [Paenibacillus riograndensis]KWX78389.1 short-chain dehydrogenase [Paenibacillus riograndensis]
MRLTGKKAIVTGAARGIGYEVARRFAEEGAAVVMADINPEGNHSAQQLQRAGLAVTFCRTDVASNDSVVQLVDTAMELHGGIDILVNNAAVNIPGSILELSEEIWDRTYQVNVKSMFLLSRAVIPIMQRSGSGAIVNMGSANSYVAEPRLSAYVSSKGAILMLSKAMALDFAAEGIRVNCICPGWVDTAFNDSHAALFGGREEILKNIHDIHPIGRTIQPVEIANTALFLVSDEASAITGAGILVDGGYTIK